MGRRLQASAHGYYNRAAKSCATGKKLPIVQIIATCGIIQQHFGSELWLGATKPRWWNTGVLCFLPCFMFVPSSSFQTSLLPRVQAHVHTGQATGCPSDVSRSRTGSPVKVLHLRHERQHLVSCAVVCASFAVLAPARMDHSVASAVAFCGARGPVASTDGPLRSISRIPSTNAAG